MASAGAATRVNSQGDLHVMRLLSNSIAFGVVNLNGVIPLLVLRLFHSAGLAGTCNSSEPGCSILRDRLMLEGRSDAPLATLAG